MKKILILVLFSMGVSFISIAQIKSEKMKVISITEYIDGYLIKAVDSSKSDTINVISRKGKTKHMAEYKKMIVGGRYDFYYDEIGKKMAAMPPDNFVVRIKTTIVWRNSDGVKNMPVIGKNVAGMYIRN